mmetsp:Transcript_3546/g.5343  ORF Transcript_3546/g.5343 Transcript_3546/m.5343 type:complete len:102 (-) Transcript_3546:274-579(-)
MEAFNKVKTSICKGFEDCGDDPVLQIHQFDLILLDLHMPITNGYEACGMIRELYNNKPFFVNQLQSESHRRISMSKQPQLFKPLMVANTAFISEQAFQKTV